MIRTGVQQTMLKDSIPNSLLDVQYPGMHEFGGYRASEGANVKGGLGFEAW